MQPTTSAIDPWLRRHLVCPRDERSLVERGGTLTCDVGHSYPCIDGIPVMLLDDVTQTHWIASYSVDHLADQPPPLPADGIDPYVREALGATCGNLYARVGGTMTRYPIPSFSLQPRREQETLLDVGCNWGRWTVSAARQGFQAVGIDPSLPGIRAARRVSAQLGVRALYVVGDARHLPFRRASFDTVFSYSVLQHFAPADLRASVQEAGRVLAPNGRAVVQMPNKFGLRNLLQQTRRGFATPREFQVRYWALNGLRREFERGIGPVHFEVDGYFSLNTQMSDVLLLPRGYRAIVRSSDWLRRKSAGWPLLVYAADSLYVHAAKTTK